MRHDLALFVQMDSPLLVRDEVVHAFLNDALYLFMGAGFAMFGIVIASVSILRRKLDPLFIWLAVFAFLDGSRFWLQSELLMIVVTPSHLFENLRSAIDYIVPLPSFLFYRAAGVLNHFLTKLAYILGLLLLCLFAATFIFGPLRLFHMIDNIALSAAILALAWHSRSGWDLTKLSGIIRQGLLVYAACILCSYAAGAFGYSLRLEPFGFAFLLGSLGYVTARRTLDRDQELNEVNQELAIAKQIQLALLPACLPRSSHFAVAARYVPMTAVAGDIYEFLVLDDQQAGLLIADVSGHGVPAALIASMVKLAATSQRAHFANPAALLSAMNALLCGNTQTQLVTAAYLYLNSVSREFRYSAAGHPPMILLRGGDATPIEENGLMLAAFESASYATGVHALKDGDRLLLYTDGVVEATNQDEVEFGQDRLCTLLKEGATLPITESADLIVSSVQRWSATQSDDLTVLLCEYCGA
jgi:sigma-B regulation protein RsbU (phosphoserine phosphatase)